MAEEDSKVKKELARLSHFYSLEYEMIRATVAFEHAILRPLFLLNGGALVAYLTLFGALRPPTIDMAGGKYAIFFWVGGLLLATFSACFGALSQSAFRSHRGRQVAKAEIELGLRDGSVSETDQAMGTHEADAVCRRKVAVVLGVVSILLFIAGFWPAFWSVKLG
jgi:hypothetical protein